MSIYQYQIGIGIFYLLVFYIISNIRSESLLRIANYINISVDYLLSRTENPKINE